MQNRFSKLVVAAGAAAIIATGAMPRPAQADATTTRNILLAAAAAGAVILYENWQHKQQQANAVVGYTPNGGTVYADGRIVEPNGQTIYPDQNGNYNFGQYGYANNTGGRYNGQYNNAQGGWINGKYYGPGQYNSGQYGNNNGRYNGQYNNAQYQHDNGRHRGWDKQRERNQNRHGEHDRD
ncbi:MAG: hypothetical protein QOI11_1407 [Candidatus Eremiobacteraeota bacterium]|nr:hypothetical protein [Candidatus Eremiobacteraeota bacterium]